MGNRRNLRRASSQEEDEGDVFDDKSEISSGSDEEESSRGVDALGGSSDTAVDVGVSSSTRCVAEPAVTGGHFAVSTNRTKAFAEAPADAETRSSRKAVPETDVGGPRRGIPRGDGGKPRIKTTWQLMQEDPSFVPRETRYFLHDDRRDCDGEESEASKQTSDSDPETSLPKSTQTRVGQSKKLWTPDEDKGVWKHDMWEQLQKDDAEALTTASSWTRGRSNGVDSTVLGGDAGEIIGGHALPVAAGLEALMATAMSHGVEDGGREAGAEGRAGVSMGGSSTSLDRLRRRSPWSSFNALGAHPLACVRMGVCRNLSALWALEVNDSHVKRR
ncbi:hypothetical protein cyc_06384 [Cyclospora cayetanensis]|uniref:Btz domain-containing protein n=1 Tax=Cyclospora cayetanensis TaxID=88456 RepID=A0A1D3DAE6_9EIME|nr:hypothetical protein cyc_06384 [Cyclospora cayetanensis]